MGEACYTIWKLSSPKCSLEASQKSVSCMKQAVRHVPTMPQRDTVAGEATARSWTSNSMRMVLGFSLMRSPLGRHSVQLSSSTAVVWGSHVWNNKEQWPL